MEKQIKNNETGNKISRKEAIKKVGISTLAASSFLLLSTKAHAGGSTSTKTCTLTPSQKTNLEEKVNEIEEKVNNVLESFLNWWHKIRA